MVSFTSTGLFVVQLDLVIFCFLEVSRLGLLILTIHKFVFLLEFGDVNLINLFSVLLSLITSIVNVIRPK